MTRAGIASIALLLTAAAGAAPSPQQVQQAEQARAAALEASKAAAANAAAATAEEQRLAAQRVGAAARLRSIEDATNEAAGRVQTLAQRQLEAQAKLEARSADIAPLLPLIERLSLFPTETLLAVPMPPDDAVRGVLVLAGISRRLEADAASLRSEQAALAAAQAALAEELPKLAAAQAAQAQAESALDAQIAAAQQGRRTSQDAGAEAARRAAAEAARASSLRAALATIEAQRRADEARTKAEATPRREALAQPAGPGLGAPAGALTAPVAGSVVRGFGEDSEGGPANGISYQAPPGARVVSPCGGRVVFAGPFRSFGQLLIVNCGGGYHFVLAGFERLDAQIGAAVQAGEPVGIMPRWDPQTDPHSAGARPSLYVELRRDGQPVNPAPFLRAKS